MVLHFVYVHDWVVCQALDQCLIIVLLDVLETLERDLTRLLLFKSIGLQSLLLLRVYGRLVHLDLRWLYIGAWIERVAHTTIL